MKSNTLAFVSIACIGVITLTAWYALFKPPTLSAAKPTAAAKAPQPSQRHLTPFQERLRRGQVTAPKLLPTPTSQNVRPRRSQNQSVDQASLITTFPDALENDTTVLNPYSYFGDFDIRPPKAAPANSKAFKTTSLPIATQTPEPIPGKYKNSIGPDEDLLQLPSGQPFETSPYVTTPPAAEAPQPTESNETARQPQMFTTSNASSSTIETESEANEDEEEDLLTGSSQEALANSEPLPPPTNQPNLQKPPATGPPASQSLSATAPGGMVPADQAWNKDQPPQADEDLLRNMPKSITSVGRASETPNPIVPNRMGSPSPSGAGALGRTVNANPHASTPKTNLPSWPEGVDPHLDVYSETLFPSAQECRKCHEQIYDEWAVSSHAYASISPMFQKFEQTIHALTQGTISYFCYRCHAPVATTIGHPREANIWDSVPSATEGVTCIACHRVDEDYGKVNGERRVIPGSIHEPVYGFGYGEGLKEVLANKSRYKVKTDPSEKGPGQPIHGKVIHFEQIGHSHFCVSCHQVAVVPGIALEVVWAQYRASPACKQGITCQECHMGAEPGVAAGYETGPVAVVNNIGISPDRKHSNHMFYGPGYSIAHPGVFPFNPKADDWTVREWMEFDYRAGWGTKEFEDALEEKKINAPNFPEIWEEADDRMDAREIVDVNLGKLEDKRRMRHRLMENGSDLHGPVFEKTPRRGRPLVFHYDVTNTNPGHNMPSGSLGAQPQVWLNVALTGPNGQHLWESGYVDRNGDVADVHSLEVAAGRIQRDLQLFNLQTKFLITHVKGTDREMYLPINTDIDQLPFIRQSGFPITVMNHPPFIRMEAHSLPPLGTRQARYRVPAKLMRQPGVYRLSVRMRSRAEPIYFMRFCKATPEMERNMNEWMLDYHEEAYEFVVP